MVLEQNPLYRRLQSLSLANNMPVLLLDRTDR